MIYGTAVIPLCHFKITGSDAPIKGMSESYEPSVVLFKIGSIDATIKFNMGATTWKI